METYLGTCKITGCYVGIAKMRSNKILKISRNSAVTEQMSGHTEMLEWEVLVGRIRKTATRKQLRQ